MAQAVQPPPPETYNYGPQNYGFRGRGRARGRSNATCHSCGAFGHLRRDCPKKCMYLYTFHLKLYIIYFHFKLQ